MEQEEVQLELEHERGGAQEEDKVVGGDAGDVEVEEDKGDVGEKVVENGVMAGGQMVDVEEAGGVVVFNIITIITIN